MKIQTQSSSWNQELTEDQYFRATKTPFGTQNMLMTGKSKTLAGIPTNKGLHEPLSYMDSGFEFQLRDHAVVKTFAVCFTCICKID